MGSSRYLEPFISQLSANSREDVLLLGMRGSYVVHWNLQVATSSGAAMAHA